MKQLSIGALSPYLFCLLLAAICACSDDSDNGVEPPPEDEIETDLTDPAAVIDSHEKALTQKDHLAYEALLDGDFEFVPLERDAQDFPWLQGSSWPKAEELGIIGNMFNPDFAGDENPIDAIEVSITVLSQQTLPTGRIELTTTMQGRVLTTANDGWSFDTRVVFELITREGFLRIVQIKETDAVLAGRGAAPDVEATSWANIKTLYRAPILTNLTDPAAVIETHELALKERNIDAYQALLDEAFEFFPLDRDVADFPWMDGLSWPKAQEVSILGNMCDSQFSGQENPVDQIDSELTILSQLPLEGGRIELTCNSQGRVLTAANDGWSFDTRMVFELVPRGEFLRIVKITEVDAVREGSTRVEESSWGSIKGLYRTGS